LDIADLDRLQQLVNSGFCMYFFTHSSDSDHPASTSQD